MLPHGEELLLLDSYHALRESDKATIFVINQVSFSMTTEKLT
jgi:hypothetical protein